jgi:circadian clock protein KaiB
MGKSMENEPVDSSDAFEKAVNGSKHEKYVLKLYVSGSSPKSTRAISNIREICEQYLPGRYELEVIDIYQQPELARSEQIVAAPTLIKKLPIPLRRMIGDLTRTERIKVGLDLRPGEE